VEYGTLRAAAAEVRRRGWRNKGRKAATAGHEFTTTTLHALLTNVLYIGQMRAGDDFVPGAHEAIVPRELWDAVQAQLRENANDNGVRTRNKTGALLRGLLRCTRCDSPMTHTFSTKGNKRYRFYTCHRLHTQGKDACPDSRVSAGPFENFVAKQIRMIGTDEALLAKTADALERCAVEQLETLEAELRRGEREPPGRATAHTDSPPRRSARRAGGGGLRERAALASFTPVWECLFPAERERILRLLIERITYDPDTRETELTLRPSGIDALAKEATP
jgi:site-specific DNA recombinase